MDTLFSCENPEPSHDNIEIHIKHFCSSRGRESILVSACEVLTWFSVPLLAWLYVNRLSRLLMEIKTQTHRENHGQNRANKPEFREALGKRFTRQADTLSKFEIAYNENIYVYKDTFFRLN